MRVGLIVFICTVILGAGAALVYRRVASGSWQFPDGQSLVRLPKRLTGGAKPRVMKTIFLERHGATITPGDDDSARNVSSIVREAGKASVTIPKFRGGDKAWRQFVDCVRAQYAPFDVLVTEERPSTPGYVLTVVGGMPKLVGFPRSTGGLAPYSGEPIADPVVFVFSDNLGGRTQVMCETAAMEIAHAYGLDHEFLCKDPMSYLHGCGKKSFQDQTVPCGEKKARVCGDGQPTQNSYRRLLGLLGPARPGAEARR